MLSAKSWIPAVLMGASLLLCTTPLSAALRSRTSTVRVKSHGSARVSHARTRHGGAHGKAAARSSKPRFHGQQSIDPERTLEIQQALVQAHYLSGDPSGQWDQATRSALVRLQDDNHWQTKIVPDSRALIKLGLGPSPQNLLNPESAALATAKPGPAPETDSN